MSTRSLAEEAFAAAWRIAGLAGADMVREHRFHPVRRWRFDFAFPSQKLAVELEGQGGGHSTVKAVRDDCEKFNTALMMGWRVLRFPSTDRKQAIVWVGMVKEVLCCTPTS